MAVLIAPIMLLLTIIIVMLIDTLLDYEDIKREKELEEIIKLEEQRKKEEWY